MPGKNATPKKAEESPYKKAVDSPSRQLLWEMQQLSISNQRTFYETLDQRDQINAATYEVALGKAAISHDRVRMNAENVLEKHRMEVESELAVKRAEDLARAERAKREKLEKELAETKEANKARLAVMAAETKLEEEKKSHETALEKARVAHEQAKAEQAKKSAERDHAERKKQAEAKVAPTQEARKAQVPVAGPSVAAQTPVPDAEMIDESEDEMRAAKHAKYLEIHQKLKHLRKDLAEKAKSDAELKQGMGNSRRTIRKCIGQLTGELAANKARVSHRNPNSRQPQANLPSR